MKHRYLPMTELDQQEMLATIGVATIDELLQTFQKKCVLKANIILKKQNQKRL